jgi:PKD repeat protein
MNVYSGGTPQTGSTYTNTVFLGGHALNFPNDIRFTDSNDNDYYYYLVYSNATYAQFEIRVTNIPATGNQVMRVYYGKANGESASDAANTYDYYSSSSYKEPPDSYYMGTYYHNTLNTAPRSVWYRATVNTNIRYGGNTWITSIGSTSADFHIGVWSGMYDYYATSETVLNIVYTDGKTTDNIYVYSSTGTLLGTYSKDFGTSHTLVIGGENSVDASGQSTWTNFYATAYTANPPAMGNWGGETTAALPTVTLIANVTSGIAPFAVMFNSTSPSGVESWSWNFGDGWISTSQNISHLYSGSGNYTVSLTGTNAYGSKTAYTTITAHSAPNASFTYLAGSVVSGTQTYYFYDTSTGDPATSWAWSFGDNGSLNSTAQNPTHTYTEANEFKVIMTATNDYGSSSASVNLTVKIDTSITGTIIVTNNNIACGSGLTVRLLDQSGVVRVSSTTSSNGAVTLMSVTPGTTYTVEITGTGIPSYTGKVTFSSLDTKFWIDVATGIVTPDSQKVLTTHTTQLRITHWLGTSPERYINTVLLLNGINASTTTPTDYNGYVSFLVQSNVMYGIWMYNESQGINVTRYLDLSGTSYSIDISGSGSWFYNSGIGTSSATNTGVEGSTGNPDQDIITDATGFLDGASSTITCNYTDISQSTLAVNFDIYKFNNTGPMLPMDLMQSYSHVYVGNISDTYNLPDSDPAGKTYVVYVNSTYTLANGGTGTLSRAYTVSFPGPLRMIPGLPGPWYKYLAIVALIVIGLIAGKFGVEESSVAICVFASVFFAMQWFYEINNWYMGFVIGAAWTMTIASIWYKREREGKI